MKWLGWRLGQIQYFRSGGSGNSNLHAELDVPHPPSLFHPHWCRPSCGNLQGLKSLKEVKKTPFLSLLLRKYAHITCSCSQKIPESF